ncbi:Enterobactin synthetase component F, serine activating enzyme (plasmid) [Klebsiella aerogenes]|nr:Enterobactin synthetase component F, serine activating enzyme [Klebsiella aerogenes]
MAKRGQWVDDAREFAEPQSVDLRQQADPHMSALTLMQSESRAESARRQRVIRWSAISSCALATTAGTGISAITHLLVDGFSFPAITRQIAAIYRAWQRGEETPDSPFTPFAEVVEEYQRYYGSEACAAR